MIIKYAVLNPLNGQYTKVDSEEEAKKMCVKFIIEFFNSQVHFSPISIIEIDDNGNETWKAKDNGTELPEEYLIAIENESV